MSYQARCNFKKSVSGLSSTLGSGFTCFSTLIVELFLFSPTTLVNESLVQPTITPLPVETRWYNQVRCPRIEVCLCYIYMISGKTLPVTRGDQSHARAMKRKRKDGGEMGPKYVLLLHRACHGRIIHMRMNVCTHNRCCPKKTTTLHT